MFGFFKKKTPVPAKAVPPPLPPLPVAAPVADPPPARQGENGFHLNQELVPETELEQLLWNAKQGHATYEEVINGFLQSQVKILDTEFDPAQRNLLHRPFLQYGPHNETLLALFTTTTRADLHRQRHPQYRCLKTLSTVAVIRSLPPDMGLVLNSGWKVGLQLGPAEVAEIRSQIL
jgi:hypothetical protein